MLQSINKRLRNLGYGGNKRGNSGIRGTNKSLAQVKASEADYLGKQFVGSGYTTFEYNGKTGYISKDGTRVYRPPSQKPNSPFTNTGTQANFEYRIRNPDTGKWEITKNGHIDIIVE